MFSCEYCEIFREHLFRRTSANGCFWNGLPDLRQMKKSYIFTARIAYSSKNGEQLENWKSEMLAKLPRPKYFEQVGPFIKWTFSLPILNSYNISKCYSKELNLFYIIYFAILQQKKLYLEALISYYKEYGEGIAELVKATRKTVSDLEWTHGKEIRQCRNEISKVCELNLNYISTSDLIVPLQQLIELRESQNK